MNELAEMHPEDLLDRAAVGALTPNERAHLDAHLERCDVCAAQVRLLEDFEREELDARDDGAIAARSVDAALAVLDRVPATGHAAVTGSAVPQVRTVRWPRLLLAAAIFLLLAGGVATAWMLMRPSSAEPEVTPETEEPERPARTRSEQPVIALDEVHIEAPSDESASARARPRRPRAVQAPTAAELLAEANAARRAGRESEAAELYRDLHRAHPRSRETRVSRIALGRLLLDRLSDPAGALAQFDAYLADAGDATLAEEARVGRALALGRLGRTARERQAWEDVIAHHPSSVHVPRARERIRELDAAP